MNSDEVTGHIQSVLDRILEQKGLEKVTLDREMGLLDGRLPIDSLDLAVLVTELEQATRVDPFKGGFRNFRTVGELAALYADGPE